MKNNFFKKGMFKSKTGVGEGYIWFTGLGLAIGLMMVVGLLALILYQGIASFWPKKVYEIVTTSGEVYWGEIRKEREKISHTLNEEGVEEEIQIFKGNKDAFGEGFQYINSKDIQSRSLPKDIMVFERKEYGNAIGVPVALNFGGNNSSVLSPNQKEFFPTLKNKVKEVVSTWEEIEEIEKDIIGKINKRMEKIKLRKKEMASQKIIDQKKNLLLDEQQNKLQSEYQQWAQKSYQMRQDLNLNKLVIRLADKTERSIPLGNILSYTFPNQMNIFSRFIHFIENGFNFLMNDPREANTEGGVFPALFGTFVMTILMSAIVTPFGVLAAVYLKEYARQGWFTRIIRISVNNLAGVPSIVFGVFGLGFFVYVVGGTIDHLFFKSSLPTPTFGTGGLLWASLTLALMTVPVVIVATEEALSSVSSGMRESSLACGASKWQTCYRVVLPAAAPGILTGMILAMARGAGEVAPLMLVGVVKLAPTLPLNSIFPYIHLDQKFMHMGFHIYDLGFQSPDSEAAMSMVFATTLLLITLIVVMNIGAIYLRERLRRKYATGAF